jgi:hypothetical protein
MKELFKSSLDRIEADKALVRKTEARLRNELAKGQNSRTKLMNGRIYEMKKFAIAACLALLLIGGGFAYATPTSYLSVDINPSVELGINTIGQVVSVETLNEDGKNILSGIDVTGMKVKKAVSIIVDAAADKGYLNNDGSSVVSLTVATDDKEKADKLTKDAEEGTETALDENETSAEVSQAAISMARRDAAIAAGISPGKMNLIQKLWEATENDGVAATKDDFEEILTLIDKINEFNVTAKVEMTIISLSAVERRAQAEPIHDASALPIHSVELNLTTVCSCRYPMKKKNYDKCAMCGGKWTGRIKQTGR